MSNLGKDRNRAVNLTHDDIILFLDDDTILGEDYVKRVVGVFENDKERRIEGVTGNIVNAAKRAPCSNIFLL